MITLVRTASIAPGKLPEAMAFAHKVADLVKNKTGGTISISMPIGGNPNRIAWVSVFANLAELEEGTTKLLGDRDYLSLLAAAATLFLPGSVHDEMWRSV
jgi:hypothetical protein